MGSCSIPVKSLSSGRKMPVIGMGTADSNLAGCDASRIALVKAIEVGYRHFDTASIYQSEQNLGDAIAQALELGLIKSRDELFITSKLWSSDSHPDRVVPALQESLRKLKLEYLDLYLIHWPASSTPGIYEFPIPKDEIFPLEYETIWAAMEECQRLGLTKSIGVSNFSSKKLQTILNTATIPPAANQVSYSSSIMDSWCY